MAKPGGNAGNSNASDSVIPRLGSVGRLGRLGSAGKAKPGGNGLGSSSVGSWQLLNGYGATNTCADGTPETPLVP